MDKRKGLSPFDFINSINNKTANLIEEEPAAEKQYVSFIVNRGLSYFVDTVLYANQINMNDDLDAKMKYDYLYHSIRKKRRFSKWQSAKKDEDLVMLMEHYKYSASKARQALSVLTTEQLQQIRKTLDPGGVK